MKLKKNEWIKFLNSHQSLSKSIYNKNNNKKEGWAAHHQAKSNKINWIHNKRQHQSLQNAVYLHQNQTWRIGWLSEVWGIRWWKKWLIEYQIMIWVLNLLLEWIEIKQKLWPHPQLKKYWWTLSRIRRTLQQFRSVNGSLLEVSYS